MPHDAHDVLILGGGPAGLSAALYLGRARRRVGVLDAGDPRHAVSEGVHNFLTREGMPPALLRQEAWAQMAQFPSVTHHPDTLVEDMTWEDEVWTVRSTSGVFRARAVLLAVGVRDELPAIKGFEQKWGRSIHQCPYCHGWEVRDQPLAVLGSGEYLKHMPALLKGWSQDIVVVTHGEALDEQERAMLAALDVGAYTQPIAALEGAGESARTHPA